MQEEVTTAKVVFWMVNPDVDFKKQINTLSRNTIIQITERMEGWFKLPDDEYETLIDRYVEVTHNEI